MSQTQISVNSVSNADGNELFEAICTDALKMKVNEVKGILDIPKADKATMKDVISLLQDVNIFAPDAKFEVKFSVTYENKEEVKSNESDDPFA